MGWGTHKEAQKNPDVRMIRPERKCLLCSCGSSTGPTKQHLDKSPEFLMLRFPSEGGAQ